MVSQVGLLKIVNSAYVWWKDLRDLLDYDTQYLAGSNQLRDFKFVRVVRSRYLVSLYICYILLNVCDKNPLYGILKA